MRKSTMALVATAYHEAGHAVAAFCMDKGLKKVSIQPDQATRTSGHCQSQFLLARCHPDHDVSDRVRLRIEREVVVYLTGDAAQRKFNPRSCRNFHSSQDYDNAIELLGYLTQDDEELRAYFLLLSIWATRLVESQTGWIAIAALAHALLEKRTLTGLEATAVIREAIDGLSKDPDIIPNRGQPEEMPVESDSSPRRGAS